MAAVVLPFLHDEEHLVFNYGRINGKINILAGNIIVRD